MELDCVGSKVLADSLNQTSQCSGLTVLITGTSHWSVYIMLHLFVLIVLCAFNTNILVIYLIRSLGFCHEKRASALQLFLCFHATCCLPAFLGTHPSMPCVNSSVTQYVLIVLHSAYWISCVPQADFQFGYLFMKSVTGKGDIIHITSEIYYCILAEGWHSRWPLWHSVDHLNLLGPT